MTHTNETPRERLERLRAEHADLAQRQADAASAVKLPTPGDTVHCLVSGTTISTGGGWLSGGAVLQRGSNLVITAAMLEASKDAGGSYTGPALAHDPEQQVRVHGRVLFGPGPAPTDMLPERDTAEWREAREQARQAAWAHPDPAVRGAALRAVSERFGPAPQTSTHWKQNDPTIAAAEAQQRALNEGGLRFSQSVQAREAGVVGERR